MPPNHTGPCPNCGKTGTSAEVFGYGRSSASAQVQVIQAVVNASGSSVFASHNTPVPSEWPEAVSAITTNVIPMIQNEVRATLEQHDKEIEDKERSLRNRLIKIGISIFWILVGIALDRFVNLIH
ncbi:MAG: hypothetical protein WCC94_07795 [Candidatus Bathyarchaeia archaeon]